MPLYEYYCQQCDGVFEAIRPIREASLAVPCPFCHKDGQRLMPSSFTAFTMRDGYPRRLPDRGTYWHLGKEVKTLASSMVHNQHPELTKPEPPPRKSKGERKAEADKKQHEAKEKVARRDYIKAPNFADTDKKYYLELWQDHQQSQKKREKSDRVV